MSLLPLFVDPPYALVRPRNSCALRGNDTVCTPYRTQNTEFDSGILFLG